ncbi:MAG: phenylalanine--tRNA ligase subunit beta [Deltaproteobacteria bacterium]|nr:phenylalanine--tRNA ligase subunit beta [Deltaproteobacteria bacterium]
MKVSYEWLTEFVAWKKGPKALGELLSSSGLEVESYDIEGQVFDIAVTPNRPDCLSVIGLAREISALSGARFLPPPPTKLRGEGKLRDLVSVTIRDRTRCPRYSARGIRGVRIAPSPAWLIKRLEAAGVRPINNVVDATNYVMLEMGQPLHAFDARFVKGKKIIVQVAGTTTQLTTLDGGARKLVSEDLLICDADGPIALAGVMGGANSEVRDDTTDILLESASFEPTGIRRTSKRLGLQTESSRRFERGVDPNGVVNALHRVTSLIIETAGGQATADEVDVYPRRALPRRISLSASETNRILGTTLTQTEVDRTLKRLGVKPRIPTSRPDLTRSIDLIEEVARLRGYASLPEALPRRSVEPPVLPARLTRGRKVRATLAASGFSEAVLMSFGKPAAMKLFSDREPVTIANPLSEDHQVFATSLLPGLLDAAKLNLFHQRSDLRLFALQKVALMEGKHPREVFHLAGVMTGTRYPTSWERAKEEIDFYDVKGVCESLADVHFLSTPIPSFLHPGSAAILAVDGEHLGVVGQLHPEVARRFDLERAFVFEINFDVLLEGSKRENVLVRPLSRYPFVERDISLILDDTISTAHVEQLIREAGGKLIQRVRLFDLYRGKGVPSGKKSLAFCLRFGSDERTLTDEEVIKAHAAVVALVERNLGASLRSSSGFEKGVGSP